MPDEVKIVRSALVFAHGTLQVAVGSGVGVGGSGVGVAGSGVGVAVSAGQQSQGQFPQSSPSHDSQPLLPHE